MKEKSGRKKYAQKKETKREKKSAKKTAVEKPPFLSEQLP